MICANSPPESWGVQRTRCFYGRIGFVLFPLELSTRFCRRNGPRHVGGVIAQRVRIRAENPLNFVEHVIWKKSRQAPQAVHFAPSTSISKICCCLDYTRINTNPRRHLHTDSPLQDQHTPAQKPQLTFGCRGRSSVHILRAIPYTARPPPSPPEHVKSLKSHLAKDSSTSPPPPRTRGHHGSGTNKGTTEVRAGAAGIAGRVETRARGDKGRSGDGTWAFVHVDLKGKRHQEARALGL